MLPASREVWAPFDSKIDPLPEWTISRAMTENPPEHRLSKLGEPFRKTGVGPGEDIDKLNADSKRGLARALHLPVDGTFHRGHGVHSSSKGAPSEAALIGSEIVHSSPEFESPIPLEIKLISSVVLLKMQEILVPGRVI